MASRIVLNTPRYRGEFPFDIEEDPLTNLEWRWIKKISGYMPLTILEGWRGGDPDLFIAFAVVALHRAGRIDASDAYMAAESFDNVAMDGSITLIGEAVTEDPPLEPAQTPETEPPIESIGESSNGTSDPSAALLEATGPLG